MGRFRTSVRDATRISSFDCSLGRSIAGVHSPRIRSGEVGSRASVVRANLIDGAWISGYCETGSIWRFRCVVGHNRV